MKLKSLLLTAVATIGLTAATMAQTVPNYVPTTGLVGWWPFNGNANDESGNGNNGTVNGATLTSDRNGLNNSAYNFSGTNDYIEIPSFNWYTATGFTFSFWVNLNSTSIDQLFIKHGTAYGGSGNGVYMNLFSSKAFITSPNFAGQGAMTPQNPFLPSNWTLITYCVLFNQYTNIYINGIQLSTPAYNGIITSLLSPSTNMFIGKDVITNSQQLNGKIDDIGIWNRALTQQEITALYTTVNCANDLSISPANNQLPTGSTANFTATTSDPNPSFIWQSDFGQGFQTLNNYGSYSGVSTATLSISNVQLCNHQQILRAISTSGNCIDTSNTATITISDTCFNTINDTNFITVTDTLIINAVITGLTPPNNQNTIKVFPNPANDHITINYGNFAAMSGYQLKIMNSLGQQVFITTITQQSDYIDLSTWTGNGVYFVHVIDPQGTTVDIRKIVLQ